MSAPSDKWYEAFNIDKGEILRAKWFTQSKMLANRENRKNARRSWYPNKKEHFNDMQRVGGTQYRIEMEIAYNDHLKAIREQMLRNRIDREEMVPVKKEETITIENK